MTAPVQHADRDSLLLMADIVAEGDVSASRHTVRNLSAGGMMAQGGGALAPGTRLSITLRNIGTVQGKVAWTRNGRHGIAFDRAIDPQAVRAPVALENFLADTLKLRPRAER